MAVWPSLCITCEADFLDADSAMVKAVRQLVDEAAAYQGSDAAIDGRGTVCTVAEKPAVQFILTVSGSGRVMLAKVSENDSVTEGDRT